MKNDIKAPYSFKQAAFTLLPLVAAIGLSSCGGGGSDSFVDKGSPTKPTQYQADSTGEIQPLAAYYDFEYSLADASSMSLDAEIVGHTTDLPQLGNVIYDGSDGIHPLSAAAVFGGISGLLLPGNIITGDSYTISMWVNPSSSASTPLFFAKSEKGTLLLNKDGLTVSGETGQGKDGKATVTYTDGGIDIPENTWSHLALVVGEGLPHIYLNGERVYKGGTLTEARTELADGFIMEKDNFNDLFSGTYNTIAIGVTDSDESTPFSGKIDNLRIYNDALYFGNITVLNREVVDEGPAAEVTASYNSPDMTVSWTIERFPTSTIQVVREALSAETTVTLTNDDNPLPATATSYTDANVPTGENYRYSITVRDDNDHILTPDATSYVRVPGDAPYAAVTAELEERDIKLSLYTENITLASYDVLRSTSDLLSTASVIASDLTEDTYTDLEADDTPLEGGTQYYYWVRVTDSNNTVTESPGLPTSSVLSAPAIDKIEEEEDGFCSVDGTVDNNNPGFTGLGFANTDNEKDKSIRWKVNHPTGGTFNLYVGYANGSADNRWGIMTANGTEIINPLDLSSTDGWTTYSEVKHSITLDAGDTDLVLTSQTDGGLANVDYLRFERVDTNDFPVGVPCAQ